MSDTTSTVEPETDRPGLTDASPSTLTRRTKRKVALGLGAALLASVAIVVPVQIGVANHQAAIDAYAPAAEGYNAAIDDHTAALTALAERQELAASEMDSFLSVIRTLPDDVLDPVEAKQAFVAAVETFRETAGVTSTPEDETVPAMPISTIVAADAPILPDDATTEEITGLTAELKRSERPVVDDTKDLAYQVEMIDTAYDAAVLQLDAVMGAARTWGDRDVYEKDTAEQTNALIAAAQALVKPEGESFADLAERVTAVDAFVAAQSAARAGHDQTVAAEEEAARQAAAAEAERQAAAQRQQQNNGGGGNGNPPSRGSGGQQPSKNTNGSGGTIPPGGGRPGGGTNGTNGGCWTSNGVGGTKPC